MQKDQVHNRVVITGMGCVSPLGNTPTELFENLLIGKTGFRSMHHGVPVALIDNSFQRICTKMGALQCKDTQSYISYAVREALISSGLDETEASVDLYVGASENLSDPSSKQGDVMNSIAKKLPFIRDYVSFPVACSGGNVAIAVAMSKIQTGRSDVCIAGGVEAFSELCFSTFKTLQILSKEGTTPFSGQRDGITIGEGAAFLVLEDLEHAKARNAPILGEIASYSIRCDAFHLNTPDPYGKGAEKAIRAAIDRAKIQYHNISYISPHGTGTIANEQQEANAIHSVFGEYSSKIPISAIKSMLGHCLGAASALEAIASVLSIQKQKIPNTIGDIHKDETLPFIPYLYGFKSIPVEYVLSNSFAFGGNIACVIFKRYII